MKLFVEGRKDSFKKLEQLHPTKQNIWIHTASLGEFEQGRPIIEALKKEYPQHQIVLTFFSPSGYEVRKNYELADVVCYLPFDTTKKAKNFITSINPSLAIFVKYEFWPNYLKTLKSKQIPTLLVSGIFRKNQSFFKTGYQWMQKPLRTFTHFFVQDDTSKNLLNNIQLQNTTVAGDTRFDRVQKLIEANEQLDFIENFKQDKYTLVAGSTWLEDEEALLDYINNIKEDEKVIIAPHNLHQEDILKLKNKIKASTVLFSEKEGKNLTDFSVFIIDTMGILSKIYAYADVAYIGGGYNKSGVHNTLEAATYGIPIVIGPNYNKFKEVIDLVALGGCISTQNSSEVNTVLKQLKNDPLLSKKQADINKNYVAKNLGATAKIIDHINHIL